MQEQQLQRKFGLSTATYVVIASMVGTGILVSPGFMMVSLQNYPLIFGLWIVGGLLALCGALCVAELAAALPEAGGEYVYLREAYGPMPAFLSGWTSFFLGFAAPLAVTSFLAAEYLLTPFDLTGGYRIQMLAALIVVAITLPNLSGHRLSGWTQDLTTVVKLALFVGLVVLAAVFRGGDIAHIGAGQPIGQVEPGVAASQLFYVMFAYSGWNAASYLAGEVRNPGRTLPRSLLLGAGSVVLLYLAVNFVFAYAVPLDAVGFGEGQTFPTQVPQLAVQNLFGGRAANVFSVLLGLTFLANVSAFVITGPRVYYAMARNGLFPAIAAKLSRKGQVPVYAMALQSLLAIVILFAMDFQSLYKYAAVGLSLFAMLFIGAVYVLRWRRPDLERPFRVPGYPVVPAIFLVITLFMAVFAFREWTEESLYAIGSILAGIPVYYVWTFLFRRRRPAAGSET